MYSNLKAEIARKGWSITRLALNIGMSYQSLSQRMRGIINFTLNEAKKIKAVLGTELSLDQLFEWTEK